jgi:hypothetical protein
MNEKAFDFASAATMFFAAAPAHAHDGKPHGFDDLWSDPEQLAVGRV